MQAKYYLSLLFITLLSCQNKEKDALTQACDYLWAQQATDGGWHSETHGIMRGGEATTAYVLWTLLEVPETVYPRSNEQIEAGLSFLRTRIHKDGYLGRYDPDIMDYPNYATAYALRILAKQHNESDKELVFRMTNYLLQEQFTEQRGINKEHQAYGAWGFGETNISPGKTGHIDLSHTRRILQALQEGNVTSKMPFKNALTFLHRLQKKDLAAHYDGGFYASTITLGTNKSDTLNAYPTRHQSYATATADGLLGLLAAGAPSDSEEVSNALKWLEKYDELSYPEGIPHETVERWHEVLFFYHLSVRAEAYAMMKVEGEWKKEMRIMLEKTQMENGSFSNPMGAPNKEDDPLIATAYAVQVLNLTR